jgi:hypothetical protein
MTTKPGFVSRLTRLTESHGPLRLAPDSSRA